MFTVARPLSVPEILDQQIPLLEMLQRDDMFMYNLRQQLQVPDSAGQVAMSLLTLQTR